MPHSSSCSPSYCRSPQNHSLSQETLAGRTHTAFCRNYTESQAAPGHHALPFVAAAAVPTAAPFCPSTGNSRAYVALTADRRNPASSYTAPHTASNASAAGQGRSGRGAAVGWRLWILRYAGQRQAVRHCKPQWSRLSAACMHVLQPGLLTRQHARGGRLALVAFSNHQQLRQPQAGGTSGARLLPHQRLLCEGTVLEDMGTTGHLTTPPGCTCNTCLPSKHARR